MYTIELLKMINKFKELNPGTKLNSLFIQSRGSYVGFLSSFETSLSYVKLIFNNEHRYENNITIKDLIELLNRNKFKKITFEIRNKNFKELDYLVYVNNDLCSYQGFSKEIINHNFPVGYYKYIYREEVNKPL